MKVRTFIAFLLFLLFGHGDSLAQSQLPTSEATPPVALQELTVVCIRYVIGTQPLQVTNGFNALSPADIALLQKCVPTGSATVWSTGVNENGPKAKAILLLTGPFEQGALVAQPWRSTVIYVQQGQEFVILPKDAALWDKCIYLNQQADNPRYTTYMADLSTGGRMGGSAGAW